MCRATANNILPCIIITYYFTLVYSFMDDGKKTN